MKPLESCVAVIPCLNEAATVGRVVRGVKEFVPDVLVVDDGSTDATSAEARAAGAGVIRHESPQGKGAALADGCAWARERGYVWALTLDGDGQHSPKDIPKFLEAAQSSGPALIIGNRMAAAGSMPPLRRIVNRWMSRKLSRVAGADLPDTQCGFRLMNLEAWSGLRLRTRNFEVESEILLEMVRSGQGIAFVPIEVIYKSEQSKIHPVRDSIRWFRWLRSMGK